MFKKLIPFIVAIAAAIPFAATESASAACSVGSPGTAQEVAASTADHYAFSSNHVVGVPEASIYASCDGTANNHRYMLWTTLQLHYSGGWGVCTPTPGCQTRQMGRQDEYGDYLMNTYNSGIPVVMNAWYLGAYNCGTISWDSSDGNCYTFLDDSNATNKVFRLSCTDIDTQPSAWWPRVRPQGCSPNYTGTDYFYYTCSALPARATVDAVRVMTRLYDLSAGTASDFYGGGVTRSGSC